MVVMAVLAALSASVTWAFASLVSHSPARQLGVFRFAHIQLPTSALLLPAGATATGVWGTVAWGHWPALVVSGLIGILLGDFALFSCLVRGGPRRMQVLFAMIAPIAAILGLAVLDESMSAQSVAGIAITLAGVVVAILHNPNQQTGARFDELEGSLLAVVFWGLLAALSQAVGLIAIKPAMVAGTDPLAASALRTGIGAVAILIVGLWSANSFQSPTKPSVAIVVRTIAAGWLGYGVAMTLLLYALRSYDVGVVATLGATVPVMMLPLIWIQTRQRPAPAAWVGAGLVVAGIALLFMDSA